jgi:hypothetical protein
MKTCVQNFTLKSREESPVLFRIPKFKFSYHQYAISTAAELLVWLADLLIEWLQDTMLSHLFTLLLVMFLGAIVCTTASRYEDDHGLSALTDQANDHQQIVYDVDHGVNASFACNVSYI